jgi:hypothetical protein
VNCEATTPSYPEHSGRQRKAPRLQLLSGRDALSRPFLRAFGRRIGRQDLSVTPSFWIEPKVSTALRGPQRSPDLPRMQSHRAVSRTFSGWPQQLEPSSAENVLQMCPNPRSPQAGHRNPNDDQGNGDCYEKGVFDQRTTRFVAPRTPESTHHRYPHTPCVD